MARKKTPPPEPQWEDDPEEPETVRLGEGKREVAIVSATIDSESEAEIARANKVSVRQMRAAVNMRIAGAPYDEIANTLEYTSANQARLVVERGLAEAYGEKDKKALFDLTNARIEHLIRLALEKSGPTRNRRDEYGDPIQIIDDQYEQEANPEQLAFMRLTMDLLGRHSKLHGLDAPTQVVVTPSQEEFNTLVATVVGHQLADEAGEADIFDAEVIEAEEDGADGELT